MTSLQQLNNFAADLRKDPELIKHIRQQANHTAAELVALEPKLDNNRLSDYALFFCLGAAWAISRNFNISISTTEQQ